MKSKNTKFLIFSLAGSLYALELAQVAEVCDPPHFWPIPMSPPCYAGAISYHGEIVAIIDLALFFDLTGNSQANKLLILKHESASLALLVDSVIKIVSDAEISLVPEVSKQFTVTTINFTEGSASLLDLPEILLAAEHKLCKPVNNNHKSK